MDLEPTPPRKEAEDEFPRLTTTEPGQPPLPPALPPLPTGFGDARLAAKGPWGFWQTAGWGAVIACAYVAVQIAVGIAYVIAITIAQGGRAVPSKHELSSNGLILAAAVTLCMPVVVGLSVLFVKLRRGPTLEDYLGLRWPAAKEGVRWLLGLIVLMAASDSLTLALGRPIVPEVMVEAYRNTSFLPMLWFGLVIAAPISEETLFRGFLFRGFAESRLGGTGTVLLTAGLWAGIHLQYDLYGIATIFVSGILLGWARLKTGSVPLCMALHGLMNLLATIEITIFFPKH